MMRTALIEPFEHYEVLYRWALMADEAGEYLTIFTSETIRQQAPPTVQILANVNWRTWPATVSWQQAVQHYLPLINQHDRVVWLTCGLAYRAIAALALRPPLHLVVHNVYSLLAPRWWPAPNWRRLAYQVRRVDPHRTQLLERVHRLWLPTAQLTATARSLTHLACRTVPFARAGHERSQLTEQTKVRIGLPGALRHNGRNYALLQEAIERAAPLLQRAVHWQVLGPVQDSRLYGQLATSIRRAGMSMSDMTPAPLTPDQYAHQLDQTDLLLLPLAPTMRFGPFVEHLGTSKIAGGIFDALWHQRPLLLPDFFPLEEDWQPLAHYYADAASLADQLVILINQPIMPASPGEQNI